MIATLINYVLQFGQLNAQQIDYISDKAKIVHLQKEDYFSKAGKTARKVGFIVDGVMRVCYYDNQGAEITMYYGRT
ncbi:cyclic nucleotide-binding domain-containing protein [Sphingobacterium bambusae]|uniref:Cyclic nucleotide-binding domain-containing protein n=1 Tax=Sphingobacterium bambusae TaxID=662858 RepID=A0ABW6BLT5_9SPHI|nr:hypothetical protein [Sphingobacterium bambusae]WPL51000.1 hypothetical protein SCB77_11120 [Sphingobacterium bambusae]